MIADIIAKSQTSSKKMQLCTPVTILVEGSVTSKKLSD